MPRLSQPSPAHATLPLILYRCLERPSSRHACFDGDRRHRAPSWTKEAVGGVFVLEADNPDAAIEMAARFPAVRFGGAVEIRPSETYWYVDLGGPNHVVSASASPACVRSPTHAT
ncbi:MAG: YciI family protein [Actinomycetota bacterium]|nr:YciI family protein [Actinomycetota bacterium]